MTDFSLTEWCYKYVALNFVCWNWSILFGKNISISGALIRCHFISKIVESINASEKLRKLGVSETQERTRLKNIIRRRNSRWPEKRHWIQNRSKWLQSEWHRLPEKSNTLWFQSRNNKLSAGFLSSLRSS